MSERKRILILGAGGIGKRHIRGFLKTGRVSVSLVEPDPSKREAVNREYPFEAVYGALDEVDLGRFDLAVIAAPAHLHIPLAMRCVDAGVPFLCEKPLAVTWEGVELLLARTRERAIPARVGFVRRCAPEVIELRKRILNGEIGRIRMAYLNLSQEYPRYRPDYRTIYYARPEMGGGCILDAASHAIDLLLWILGDVSEVAAMYDHLALEGVEVEDCCLIALRFRSGVLAHIAMNQFQKPNTSLVEFIGETGNLLLDHSVLKVARDDSGRWESRDFMEGLKPTEAHESRFVFQANAMLDLLEGKPCPLATLEEAARGLRVALAVKQAGREKRTVHVE